MCCSVGKIFILFGMKGVTKSFSEDITKCIHHSKIMEKIYQQSQDKSS